MPEPLSQRVRTRIEPEGLEEGLDALEQIDALGTARGMVSNLDEIRDWYEEQILDRLEWVLAFLNDTDYARYLHDRVGYWVMNDSLALNLVSYHIGQLVNSDKLLNEKNIEATLEEAADAVVAAYTRVVGRKDTDGREMEAPRPKHAGNWADDTVTLAKNFEAELRAEGKETVADSSDYSSPGA